MRRAVSLGEHSCAPSTLPLAVRGVSTTVEPHYREHRQRAQTFHFKRVFTLKGTMLLPQRFSTLLTLMEFSLEWCFASMKTISL